jgi:prepilin-type N-terminal cleavage/methylation domain-containing protein
MAYRVEPRAGFTIFELLVCIVILGILAAISLKIADGRKRAYIAVIQSDLRNVATAQEGYFIDSFDEPGGPRYAPSLPQLDFVASEDVLVQMVGNSKGWSARTIHKKRNDYRCAMYVGDIQGMLQIYEPAIEEGAMYCEPKIPGSQGKGKG